LAPNVDFTRSVSCVGGVPNPDPAAWMDDNRHGTHTAGIIAAAKNGIGIVGVAPNVKIAGIKVGDKDGFFYPEAVVCAFMWAGSHGIAVSNNSYFADPWLFNCKNDPERGLSGRPNSGPSTTRNRRASRSWRSITTLPMTSRTRRGMSPARTTPRPSWATSQTPALFFRSRSRV
jgi:subtilisin family serine protease